MGTPLKMTDGFGQVRTIGDVNGQTLRTNRTWKDHHFRKLDAWCFDKDAFHANPQVQVFIVRDDRGGRYLAPREAFDKYAQTINYAGHGDQLALPLEYWQHFTE